MELNMVALHKEVFYFLRTRNFGNSDFLFTLRKSDRFKRLTQGYWFHGNDKYLAVSFWSGTAWKNRTPNISFLIYPNGKSELQIDVRDSLRKREFVLDHLVPHKDFDLTEENPGQFVMKFISSSYIDSLEGFLKTQKPAIDLILKINPTFFKGKYSENKIGFLDPKAFEYYRDRVLLRLQENKLREVEGQFCSIRTIRINDFGAIKDKGIKIEDLPEGAPFIFLTGENGSGKSSILRALTLGLVPYSNEHEAFLIKTKRKPRVFLEMRKGGTKITNLTSKDYIGKKRKLLCDGFAAYGPSRLITTRLIQKGLRGKVSDTYSIFHPDGTLLDIESEVLRWKSLKGISHLEDRLETIKEILISSIKGLGNIEWGKMSSAGKITPTRYFEADDDGNVFEKDGVIFDQLASGIRSLIAMIGDMLLRLFRMQPRQVDARSLNGIVLIDEIDVHLHPKLQKEIVEILADNFQNIQFVVTTHSPIPLLGAPKGSVICTVKRTVKNEVEVKRLDDKVMFDRIMPNAILNSPIFGFEDLIPEAKDKDSVPLVDDNFNDLLLYEKLEKDVSAFLTNQKQKELIELFGNKG